MGQAAGYSHTGAGTTQHACLWDGGTPIDLGTLGYDSFGLGLNALGQAVGLSYFAPVTGPDPALFHAAFVWDPVNGMRDLNTLIPSGSGWFLRGAHDINESGCIVGYGYFQGEERAFLLAPAAPIPEPSALLLLAVSLAAVTVRLKRSR
jgi:probable HAF family extracellular repeat protein